MNIKDLVKVSGFCQWEIAEQLKISEFTLSRWLRRPEKLGNNVVNEIEKAIKALEDNKALYQKEA